MSASIKAIVPQDLGNAVAVTLKVDGGAINHTQLTRILLVVDGTTLIDSDIEPSWFDKTHQDKLLIKLGAAGLAVGPHRAVLVTYDGTNPDGVYWDTVIKLNVVQVLP